MYVSFRESFVTNHPLKIIDRGRPDRPSILCNCLCSRCGLLELDLTRIFRHWWHGDLDVVMSDSGRPVIVHESAVVAIHKVGTVCLPVFSWYFFLFISQQQSGALLTWSDILDQVTWSKTNAARFAIAVTGTKPFLDYGSRCVYWQIAAICWDLLCSVRLPCF